MGDEADDIIDRAMFDYDEIRDALRVTSIYPLLDFSPYLHPRHRKAFMSKTDSKPKLVTPEFRASYVHLVTPRAIEEGKEEKYSLMVVLPKKSKETLPFIKKLEAMLLTAAQAKFAKAYKPSGLKHWPIKDADNDPEAEEAHKGCYTFSCSNKFKPGAIDKNGNKLFAEEDLYSGAWYRVSVSPYAWDHKTGGKGVSINLDNVLKVKDDEQFTSRAKAEDDFADLLEGGGDAEPEGDGEESGDDDLLG